MATLTFRYVHFVLLVCFLIFTDTSAADSDSSECGNTTSLAVPLDELNCASQFSNDYYGIGVRLGVYFAWFSSYLANSFVEDEVSGALDANTIFLFALLVSMFTGSLRHKLAFIDGLILMQLSSGYLFGCLSLWGYRTLCYHKEGPTAINNFGKVGTHCRLLCATSISAYGVWFWIEGVQHGLAVAMDEYGCQRSKECYPLTTWFFGDFNLTGGIRNVYIMMSIGSTTYFGLMLLAAAAERFGHAAKLLSRDRITREAAWNHVCYETGWNETE